MLLPETFGAGGIQAYDRLLVQAAHDVCAARGGSVRVLSLNDDAATPDGVAWDAGVVSFRGFGRNKLRFAAAAARGVLARPDVVIVGHVGFAGLARVLRRLVPARQWFFLYGIEAWKRLRRRHRPAILGAQVTAISAFTRGTFLQSNREARTVSVLPCALDPAWTAAADACGVVAEAAPVVLCVTRLDAAEGYKGVEALVRALLVVRQTIPAARLVVVGDGDDRHRLQSIAASLALGDDAVWFAGRVSADELHRWYARCRVFALPSAGEGFGIVYAEAAWHARPAIGLDEAGSREAIVDGVTGRLVPRGDDDALAACIVELLRDPERAAAMGAAGRTHALERHDFARFREEFARLLDAGASA